VRLDVIDRLFHLTFHQKTTPDGMQNRQPRESHVQALAANFNVVRRTMQRDQLIIAMSKDDLKNAIDFTWEHLSSHLGFRKKSPTEEHFRQLVTAKNRQFGEYRRLPVLCWPPRWKPFPQIEVGQQRRLAFMDRFNLENNDDPDLEIIDEDNMEVCFRSSPLHRSFVLTPNV
jgi:hypothetical protein